MRVAIMQPYLLPYIGYWQLIKHVDTFVIYDEIQYTKKGWINRNRYLSNGKDSYFTIPLKKQSDFLHVNERIISDTYDPKKILNQLSVAYHKAPHFETVLPLVRDVFEYDSSNLFDFVYNSVIQIVEKFNFDTKIIVSSTLKYDNSLKAKYKVLAICKELNADEYVNPIGGIDLYSREEFAAHEIQLYLLKTRDIRYLQFGNEFVPNLSIIDTMMFNDADKIQALLKEFDLLRDSASPLREISL